MNFDAFEFGKGLKEGLDIMGFKKATPIQEQAIPIIQKGRDLIACAQTGTGKTAAFVLPILDKLTTVNTSNKVRTIIIAPTRELAKLKRNLRALNRVVIGINPSNENQVYFLAA